MALWHSFVIFITMGNKRDNSIIYFLLGFYTAMISWYYYHSIFWLLVHWIFWPISLVYFLLSGHLAHGQWLNIPRHFFD